MECPWPVVAAIDFGTHGTGYAWTEVIPANRDASQRKPNYRDSWPGTNRRYPKNLTALLLDRNGEVVEWGHEALNEWRHLSESGDHQGFTYVSDFKMALKPDAYQGMTPPGLGALTIDSPAAAFPLVIEYLRRMYQLALREIQGSGYLEDQIRWCVTIPAIWDEHEKQLMRDAAEAAGMPTDPQRLLLAIEPEVAALHCQVHMARVLGSQDERLDITSDGRRFTVVDCGGGTVDITSYRVHQEPGGRPRLVQIARAAGGKLGSEYINQAFIERVLEDRFGGAEVIDRIRRQYPHALGDMVDAWENYKITARTVPDDSGEPVFTKPVFLLVPGEILDLLGEAAAERLASLPSSSAHRIAVLPEECRELFDSVVLDIVEHIQRQLKEVSKKDGAPSGPERLLLVGGLSSASFLQQRLLGAFGDDVTLMVPTEPHAAVLLGAVHYGYDPAMIRSRLTRYTYGVKHAVEFRDGTDPVGKRVVDPNGKVFCDDRFAVFVRNGDTLEADDRVIRPFVPLFPTQTSLVFAFYRTVSPSPVYVDEPQCEAIGELTIELGEAMQRPPAERSVEVQFSFGETEIQVEALNVHTQQQVGCTLRFDSTY